MADKLKKDKQESEEIIEGKIFALLGYLFILCIIPLILKKDNKFCLFHAKQGLVLFLAEVAAFVLSVIPLAGKLICNFGILFFGLLSIWCMIQVLTGKYAKIPFVFELSEKIII